MSKKKKDENIDHLLIECQYTSSILLRLKEEHVRGEWRNERLQIRKMWDHGGNKRIESVLAVLCWHIQLERDNYLFSEKYLLLRAFITVLMRLLIYGQDKSKSFRANREQHMTKKGYKKMLDLLSLAAQEEEEILDGDNQQGQHAKEERPLQRGDGGRRGGNEEVENYEQGRMM